MFEVPIFDCLFDWAFIIPFILVGHFMCLIMIEK